MSGKATVPGRVTPRPLQWHGRVAGLGISWVVRAFNATWRMRLEDESGVFDGEEVRPVIFCLWHNRLALALPVFQRHVLSRQPGRRLAALVSASRDGALLADVLRRFGVRAVRGSSSRRGAQAVREMAAYAEEGCDLAITPDGPRGPRYHAQEGAVALAQMTGHVIVPTSARIYWKKCFKSWDGFQLPIPFTRCDVRFGAPLEVPSNLGDGEREDCRKELEARLRGITVD